MSKSFYLFTILALLAALLGGAMMYTPARAAGVLFAKPAATGSGNCSSWANACTLQTAIDSAVNGDQIWVQAGTHIPHPSDRTISFTLKNGVAVYGGFAGGETQLSERKPAVNVTILSGDIGTPNDAIDNSYHVVFILNTPDTGTVLDGFTLQDGNANGTSPHNVGGGIFIKGGSKPTLENLIISDNSAITAGGIWNESSSPVITNVTFSNNKASSEGGGMYITGGIPKLTSVKFLNNTAESSGGGGLFNGGSPVLTNVIFSGNTSGTQGGGNGGGMYNGGTGNPTLRNVTFSGNDADSGGGMHNDPGTSAKLVNVTFSANTAHTFGGGMRNLNSSPELINVTFSDNSAPTGGGLHNAHNPNQNPPNPSSPTLINTIIANSTGGDCSGPLNVVSSNNLIESASSACGLTDGPKGNIVGTDPRLAALANNGGFTRTMALQNGSPAIDSGNDADCPAGDQRGQARPQREHCDIGAYEALYISGDLDTTFSRDGRAITSVTPAWPEGEYVNSIAIQGNGKIVVAGRSNGNFALVRYNSNGALDATFSADGKLMINFGGIEIAYGVVVQPNGKIVVVGDRCTDAGPPCDLALARYNANGRPDATFSGDGKVVLNYPKGDNGANSLALQPDGKIVVAGYASKGADRDFAIYRFNPNGSRDKTFSDDGVAVGNFGRGKQDYIYDLEIQKSDGKIVLAGYTEDGSGNKNFAIARLNPDGTADTTFSRDGRQITNFGANDSAYGLALHDGKIMVVGETCTAPLTCSIAVARYKANGALDPTFSNTGKKVFLFGPGAYSSARGVLVTPNGKIVVAGAASGDFGLVRLLPSGALDASFSGDGKVLIDFGGNDDANGMIMQPSDGKYVLGGFTTLGGDFAIARILP